MSNIVDRVNKLVDSVKNGMSDNARLFAQPRTGKKRKTEARRIKDRERNRLRRLKRISNENEFESRPNTTDQRDYDSELGPGHVRIDLTPSQNKTDQKPGENRADHKPGQFRADQTDNKELRPGQFRIDRKPGQNRTDQKPGQNRADQKPGQNRADQRPGQNRADQRPGQNRADQRPGQNKADQRPGQNRADQTDNNKELKPGQFRIDRKPGQNREDQKPGQNREDKKSGQNRTDQKELRPGQFRTDRKPGQNRTDQKPGQNRADQRPGQNRTDQKELRPGQFRTDRKPGQNRTDQKPGQNRADRNPGQKRTDQNDYNKNFKSGQFRADQKSGQNRADRKPGQNRADRSHGQYRASDEMKRRTQIEEPEHSLFPEMSKRDILKFKSFKIRTNRCPFRRCECEADLKKHALGVHIPSVFYEYHDGAVLNDTMLQEKRITGLRILAEMLIGPGSNSADLLEYFNDCYYAGKVTVGGLTLSNSSITAMQILCEHTGWDSVRVFLVAPVNHPAALIHWSTILFLLSQLDDDQREAFHADFHNQDFIMSHFREQINRDSVSNINPVEKTRQVRNPSKDRLPEPSSRGSNRAELSHITREVRVRSPEPRFDSARVRLQSPEPQFHRELIRVRSPEPQFDRALVRVHSPGGQFDRELVRVRPPGGQFDRELVRVRSPGPVFDRELVRVHSAGGQFDQELVMVQSSGPRFDPGIFHEEDIRPRTPPGLEHNAMNAFDILPPSREMHIVEYGNMAIDRGPSGLVTRQASRPLGNGLETNFIHNSGYFPGERDLCPPGLGQSDMIHSVDDELRDRMPLRYQPPVPQMMELGPPSTRKSFDVQMTGDGIGQQLQHSSELTGRGGAIQASSTFPVNLGRLGPMEARFTSGGGASQTPPTFTLNQDRTGPMEAGLTSVGGAIQAPPTFPVSLALPGTMGAGFTQGVGAIQAQPTFPLNRVRPGFMGPQLAVGGGIIQTPPTFPLNLVRPAAPMGAGLNIAGGPIRAPPTFPANVAGPGSNRTSLAQPPPPGTTVPSAPDSTPKFEKEKVPPKNPPSSTVRSNDDVIIIDDETPGPSDTRSRDSRQYKTGSSLKRAHPDDKDFENQHSDYKIRNASGRAESSFRHQDRAKRLRTENREKDQGQGRPEDMADRSGFPRCKTPYFKTDEYRTFKEAQLKKTATGTRQRGSLMANTNRERSSMADTNRERPFMADTNRERSSMADTNRERSSLADRERSSMADTSGERSLMADTYRERSSMADTSGEMSLMADTDEDTDDDRWKTTARQYLQQTASQTRSPVKYNRDKTDQSRSTNEPYGKVPSSTSSIPALSSLDIPAPGSRSLKVSTPIAQGFDAYFHLDKMAKWMMREGKNLPTMEVESILEYQHDTLPQMPVELVGGVMVYNDPETYKDITFPLNSKWKVAIGVDPVKAHTLNPDRLALLRSLSFNPLVSAIGGVGLDGTMKNLKQQEDVLEKLLGLCMINRPLLLHIREKKTEIPSAFQPPVPCTYPIHQRCLEIVRNKCSPKQRIYIHCFMGDLGTMMQWISHFPNCLFGYSGHVFKLTMPQRQALQSAPLSKLLLETSSPYFSVSKRQSFNTPAHIGDVAHRVASIKSIPPAVLLAETTKNGKSFYTGQM